MSCLNTHFQFHQFTVNLDGMMWDRKMHPICFDGKRIFTVPLTVLHDEWYSHVTMRIWTPSDKQIKGKWRQKRKPLQKVHILIQRINKKGPNFCLRGPALPEKFFCSLHSQSHCRCKRFIFVSCILAFMYCIFARKHT